VVLHIFNEDVEEKLRAEINEVWVNQEVQPTYIQVKKMKYSKFVSRL
jgi:hypothetical protein